MKVWEIFNNKNIENRYKIYLDNVEQEGIWKLYNNEIIDEEHYNELAMEYTLEDILNFEFELIFKEE